MLACLPAWCCLFVRAHLVLLLHVHHESLLQVENRRLQRLLEDKVISDDEDETILDKAAMSVFHRPPAQTPDVVRERWSAKINHSDLIREWLNE